MQIKITLTDEFVKTSRTYTTENANRAIEILQRFAKTADLKEQDKEK